mgnify:CR=1 FL=1
MLSACVQEQIVKDREVVMTISIAIMFMDMDELFFIPMSSAFVEKETESVLPYLLGGLDRSLSQFSNILRKVNIL